MSADQGAAPAQAPEATQSGVASAGLFDALPVARLEFQLRQIDPLHLPDYAGSMLRGAFGHALRRIACVTGERECPNCPLYHGCAYPSIFETPAGGPPPQQAVNPYVIEPTACGPMGLREGDEWRFSMVLAGRSLRQLPLIVHAWRRAAEWGFGQHARRAELTGVWLLDGERRIAVAAHGAAPVALVAPPRLPVPSVRDQARLRFVTPLRLQENGRILGEHQIDAARILMALARRVQNLIDCHGENPYRIPLRDLGYVAASVSMKAELERFRWTRYSNRQRRQTDMTGLVGTVELRGDLAPFAELLAIGSMMHIGKGATFGLGRYAVESIVE